jgi:hypothetical protein
LIRKYEERSSPQSHREHRDEGIEQKQTKATKVKGSRDAPAFSPFALLASFCSRTLLWVTKEFTTETQRDEGLTEANEGREGKQRGGEGTLIHANNH